jgi:hypothetical protein
VQKAAISAIAITEVSSPAQRIRKIAGSEYFTRSCPSDFFCYDLQLADDSLITENLAKMEAMKCWLEKIKEQMNALFRRRPSLILFSAPAFGMNTYRRLATTVKTACVLNHATR